MNWFINLIFMIGCYPILFIMYLMLKNAKDRQNWCFGITLSREHKMDSEIEEIANEYKKQFKTMTIVMAILPLGMCFIPHMSILISVWMIWLMVVCFLPMYYYAKANSKVQAVRDKRGWYIVKEDTFWKYGIIYNNPADKRMWVEHRMGTGTATNMARGFGKSMFWISVVCILAMPIMCIWLMQVEFTPISTTVVNDRIVCEHLDTEYEILLSEIEEYEVLTDLPEMTKVVGNGMDNLLSGTFEVYREGMLETFLNPQNSMFIKIKTSEETYIISGSDDAQTQEVLEEIKSILQSVE